MNICNLVFVFILFQICLSQECASPCSLPLSTCTFVDYPIYPIELNVTANEQQASSIINTIISFSSVVNINKECLDAVTKYTCGFLYPGCEETSDGPLIQKPCKQMCENVQNACAAYISFLTPDQRSFINCEQKNEDGSDTFSTEGDCYQLDNLVPFNGCTNSTNNTEPVNTPKSGCQAYDPSLSPLSHVVCAPFVSSEIFVANVLDPNAQAFLDIIANASGVVLIDTLRMVIPIGCYKFMVSLLCQTAYPTCVRGQDITTGNMVEAGAPPCYEFCDKMLFECSDFLSVAGTSVQINCSSPAWPHGPTFLAQLPYQNNSQVEISCSNSLFPENSTSQFVMRDVDQCPPFLTKTERRTDSDRLCWVSCPDPSYTPQEWDNLVVMTLVAGAISLALMAFLLLSYLLIIEYRQRYMHMCIFVSAGLMGITFLMGGRKPQESLWCVDQTTFSVTTNNAACDVQGFLFQFSTLAVASWWLTVAYHMFCRIVLSVRTSVRKAVKRYYIFGWGMPGLFAVVTSTIGAHGFGPPLPFCYIQTPKYQTLNDYKMSRFPIDYALFVIPLGLTVLTAFCLMTAVAYKVYTILSESSTIREQSKSDLAVQRRLLFFIVFLFGLLLILFSWRLYLQTANPEKIMQEDMEFIVCKMKNSLGFPFDYSCPGDKIPHRLSYNYTVFETFICSGMGIFIFMALGSDKAIYRFWFKLLQLEGPTQMIKYIKEGSTYSSNAMPVSEASMHMETTFTPPLTETAITAITALSATTSTSSLNDSTFTNTTDNTNFNSSTISIQTQQAGDEKVEFTD